MITECEGYGLRKVTSIARYQEIAAVLIRHGFGYVVDNLEIKTHKEGPNQIRQHPLPKRIRLLFEDLGPTFIKLGQLLSTRPDLIPDVYVKEFEHLQDKVEEVSFEDIERQVEAEFGMGVEKLFKSFSRIPLASASIGQVHAAELPDGTRVAVKVQRRQLLQLITGDIAIMKSLAPMLQEKTVVGQVCNVDEIIDVFERQIHKEIDYNVEGLNTECFYRLFHDEVDVVVPKVYWEFTTERVLTLDYVEAMRVEDFLTLDQNESVKEIASRNLLYALFHPLMAKGVFHGDPHPGNAMFDRQGRIVLLDFGITGRIETRLRDQIAELILALREHDVHVVRQIIQSTGRMTRRINEQHFYEDVAELVERANGVTTGGMELGQLINGMLQISLDHGIKMPDSMFILGKVVVMTESIARKLSPNINLGSVLEPIALEHFQENLRPGLSARNMYRQIAESIQMLISLPKNLTMAAQSLANGDMRITFYHRNLNWLYDMLNVSSSRISYSLIIAALIVGSALIMHTGKGPLIWGYPALGTIGFVFSTLLGTWIIFELLRSNKIK